MTDPRDSNPSRDNRAEEVANWYFRLNGFLSIPGFCLHSDEPQSLITEADLLAVRFPYSREFIREIRMTDDHWVSQATNANRVVLAIVEVTTAACKVNANWLRPEKRDAESHSTSGICPRRNDRGNRSCHVREPQLERRQLRPSVRFYRKPRRSRTPKVSQCCSAHVSENGAVLVGAISRIRSLQGTAEAVDHIRAKVRKRRRKVGYQFSAESR